VSLSDDERQRLKELEQAFDLFNTTSQQLAHTYERLQGQVLELTQELAQARSERLLQLAEKERVADRLARLLGLLPAGVLVLDQMGRVTEANAAANEWLGAGLVGKVWRNQLKKIASSGEIKGEWIVSDGRILNVSETRLDKALGKIVLLMDVTEQRNLAGQLSQHQRLRSMGEMAASLAHQIRTPLAAALLYASQLSSADLTDIKRQEMSDKILARLRHLESLVTDMLQYAKGGQSGSSIIAVSDLIHHVVQVVEERVTSSDSDLVVMGDVDALFVQGDLAALTTALQNLIVNAVDVVKAHASIQIDVSCSGEWIKIAVKDQGPGIADDQQEKIFEPFYTSRAQGTGLGLAVTRAVAQAHHGRVSLSSTLGEGSCFTFWLPKQEVSA
jgi:two-component system sensor histidine kinase FlrB